MRLFNDQAAGVHRGSGERSSVAARGAGAGRPPNQVELLKEIAPGVTRVAVLRDPSSSAGIAQFGIIQTMSPLLGAQASAINMRDADEIERAVTGFARTPNGGLIITAGGARASFHRVLIIALAAQHKLPAIYYYRTSLWLGSQRCQPANR
jgi:hypothetical protein